MPINPLVTWRMQEWGMDKAPRRLRGSVRRVLNELYPEALYLLKDSKFEVIVTPKPGFSAWAYFPVHRRRCIARELNPRPETRVLLVFSIPSSEGLPRETFEDDIRDALGHALLYLRAPRAWNDCPQAMEEWRENCREPKKIARKAAGKRGEGREAKRPGGTRRKRE